MTPQGPNPPQPQDVQATFVATLVDQWIRLGLHHVVVCPGSRSTPLALAFAHRAAEHNPTGVITLHVHHDERSAAFLALGLGLATGKPAAVLTTSGTAAVELHPAVVEAHQAAVPLLALTADRPPELRHVGAPQTIDQAHLFGSAVRWYTDPGVADAAAAETWRALAGRAWAEATGSPPGPVHLNLPFREPLIGHASPLPPVTPAPRSARPTRAHLAGGTPGHPGAHGGGDITEPGPGQHLARATDPADVAALANRLTGRRGVIVAGVGSGPAPALLGETLNWPVLPDPRSDVWTAASTTISFPDAILRSPGAAAALAPDVILRLGEPPASKVLNTWMTAGDAEELVVNGPRWSDPAASASLVLHTDPAALAQRLLHHLTDLASRLDEEPTDRAERGGRAERGEPGKQANPSPQQDDAAEQAEPTEPIAAPAQWLARWRATADSAADVLATALDDAPVPNEPGMARALTAALPAEARLVVSSSMPIRDVERYVPPRSDVRVLANRGANGIDGVVSTAVGVAAGSGRPTGLLIGDIALLHDTNGLLGAAERGIDLVIVVIDNDGGGIFSFLPQATSLPETRFETLFGTPHTADLTALARAHGVTANITDPTDLASTVAEAFQAGGVHLLVVPSDRAANVKAHERLDEAVVTALESTTPWELH